MRAQYGSEDIRLWLFVVQSVLVALYEFFKTVPAESIIRQHVTPSGVGSALGREPAPSPAAACGNAAGRKLHGSRSGGCPASVQVALHAAQLLLHVLKMKSEGGLLV
jgi:hypothetical protein